eukprot:gene4579-5716_t
MEGVIEKEIKDIINTEFKPTHLEIINESYQHNVPKGSESHFKLKIVSDRFDGLSLIDQHRLVNQSLSLVIPKIHALSLVTRTPQQWAKNKDTSKSPNCVGGFGK